MRLRQCNSTSEDILKHCPRDSASALRTCLTENSIYMLGQLIAIRSRCCIMPNSETIVEERIRNFLSTIISDTFYNGFEKQLLSKVELEHIHKTSQEIVFSVNVEEDMCNRDGFLHGGAAATLLDNLSSTALAFIQTDSFWPNYGVTRTLTNFFHKAVPQGEKIFIKCTVLAVGKRMATVQAALFNSDGSKCITCVHDKFAIPISRL